MKESNIKQLRDFIKSHEKRYFIESSRYNGQVNIKKAFKVEINNIEYWVHFLYGCRPEIKNERILVNTLDEAKAKAQKWREANQKKNKEADANKKAKLEEVAEFLNGFNWYDYTDWKRNEINPIGQPIAKAIKRLYNNMPSREKEDQQTYIYLLERYINTGTIYTQALAFRKEHVVSVKYGEDGAVQIEIINGKTIIPKSQAVTNLIKTIFGHNQDGWSYKSIKKPSDEHDIVEKCK